jgi:hypothetical protein
MLTAENNSALLVEKTDSPSSVSDITQPGDNNFKATIQATPAPATYHKIDRGCGAIWSLGTSCRMAITGSMKSAIFCSPDAPLFWGFIFFFLEPSIFFFIAKKRREEV